jgi:hypothetical protein
VVRRSIPPPDAYQSHIALLNRYCHALDTRDWELLASLFDEGVIFSARLLQPGGEPARHSTRIEGRTFLVAALRDIWKHLSATHHMISNHVIEASPDGMSGRGSCYIRAYHAGAAENAHLFEESLGRFDFETIHIDKEWRIRRWDENIMVMLGTRKVFGHSE